MISFTDHNGLDIQKILGEKGLVAKSYAGFEIRPEQLKMAEAVQKAFNDSFHLAVEAGTGVGKSFAYLVGAIDQVQQKKGKVLLSTYTITLQQQLINKDIPFLSEILPHQFTACLAKGRGNYLCLRRLEYATRKQKGLFDDFGVELSHISDWSKNTEDGSLSDLFQMPDHATWDAIKASMATVVAESVHISRIVSTGGTDADLKPQI